jgi:Uma2 family endonuclease
MAHTTLVSVSEYLATTYRPDQDYLDGELQERNVGEQAHSRLQTLLAAYLVAREAQFRIRVLVEQRVQVSPTRFRVPDICVLLDSDPEDPIVRKPPLLCIEVLSKDDTVSDLNERIADFFRLGVRCVWVIDPLRRKAFIYTPEQMREVRDGFLRTQDPEIVVPLAEVMTLD